MDLDKILTEKFLDKAKDLSLAHKNEMPPKDRPDLSNAKIWSIGVLMALVYAGYEVRKKDA